MLTYTMSLVHVFCSMESHWRMLHSVYRLALFSCPKGPASLSLNACVHVPLMQQNPLVWSSIVEDRFSLSCTFPPSFQVDAGAGPGSQEKFMNLNFDFFLSRIGMSHIGRLIDWSPTNIHLKMIIQIIIWATHLFLY